MILEEPFKTIHDSLPKELGEAMIEEISKIPKPYNSAAIVPMITSNAYYNMRLRQIEEKYKKLIV